MNPRQMIARTVILIMSDQESLRGTVEPESTKTCFVLSDAVVLMGDEEAGVQGRVLVAADKPAWVQVV